MDKVIIYADGACRGNQFNSNIGAYGTVLIYKEKEKCLKGTVKDTTNNKMEILSCIKGLEAIFDNKRKDLDVEIYTDSQYVVGTMQYNWKRNANIELWNILDDLVSEFNSVTFFKVKGHSDNKYNILADKLCNEAMDAVK